MFKPVKIVMAGLAHPHGISFLKDLLKFENVDVVGFYDEEAPDAAVSAAEQFGATAFDSLDGLFEQNADLFLTAAVNDRKPDLCIRALKAGLTVAADKPFAVDLDGIDKLEKALEGLPPSRFFPLFTERYVPEVIAARSLIESGEVGTPVNMYFVRPHRLNPARRPGWMFERSRYGGIINDIGVHDIDLARYFSGSEVERVLSAHTANSRYTEYPDFCDNGAAMLRMASGASASLSVNWLTPEQYPCHGNTRFFINATKGEIDISTTADLQARVRFCSDSRPPQYLPLIETDLSPASDLIACLRDPKHIPLVTAVDAINSTRAALLAQKAAEK
ncbi:MAG: Gfo/Idh/MocA family oxidoreductase [Clostridia bacterium]|nr:Gfo/Idh/MocA family oxidoreductase [Clostridia bacterium]